MEPATIDWKDSRFVEDDLYEHLNAPKWVDLSAPEEPGNDEAWFCRPDCNHPKTVEDFFKSTPNSKPPRSAGVSPMVPLGDQNRRDVYLKRRGVSNNNSKFNEDSENQNPNLSTPPNQHARSMKAAIKSSTEKKMTDLPNSEQDNDTPSLRRTLSARNLFAGRDILNHITEFCNELKKMAVRAKEKENVEKLNEKKSPMGVKKEPMKGAYATDDLGYLDGGQKERKPLLEVGKEEKSEALVKSVVKEKQRRKKRADDAENTPLSLDIKNTRPRGDDRLLQIRTSPPTPQCFSAASAPAKTTPTSASRPRLLERGILQEVEQSNKEGRKEEPTKKTYNGRSIVAEKEARSLDVFWFLKPCTLSS